MASIILSAAGSALGAESGLPFGTFLGQALGQAAGGFVDNALFGPSITRQGPRLADLAVQTSTYGNMIPIVYGTMRLAGNLIWSEPLNEVASTSTSSAGGKGGGGGVSESTTTYSYYATAAVAICEGPIDSVLRIWADAKQLDLSQFTLRIYNGDEDQLPDSLIQSIEGAANTPAYRGMAYVVFESFPLADYGNRIPNFTFEVKKKEQYPDYNSEILEDVIDSMILIPGSGEFVYDTTVEYKIDGSQVGSGWVQQGSQQAVNMQNANGKANVLLSLDQLADTCPNVEWVSVVATWFGTDMDAGSCVILPGVEYQTGATTSPDTWQVGGFTRSTAHQITLVDGLPQYGGTPDDNSLLRLLAELRSRGYKIMFYPMISMDVTGKQWRGNLTGTASDVSGFFTKTNGYNAFINHYASLVAGHVDGFIIGSELKGLTAVTDTPGNYPAVNQLVSLAATVKSALGGAVTVTYAADWSEYHHADSGWYNLDPLWASSNIDVIGIDAYFPLTNAPQDGYDIASVIAGWTSGEGYDWYYSDGARTIQASLSPPYAWKNIDWFWNNTHINPNGSSTAWVPKSKKIWFTEFGFPSVDGAANQPNVFYDPSSSASAFPYFSKGRVDFLAQRTGLMATEQKWAGSSMIERMFVWTWDARPFPYWPDLTSVWTDGQAWKTGHWVQGKLGVSSLSAILSDLCARTGLASADINVGGVNDQVQGFIISSQQTVRQIIETLQKAYFFDVAESDNILVFLSRGGSASVSIPEGDLVPSQSQNTSQLLTITRAQEIELPKRVNIVYLNSLQNYQSSTQYSQRQVTSSLDTVTLDFPLVLDDQLAKNIADISLFSGWTGRTTYQFNAPVKYAALEPGDVITVSAQGITHTMRITMTRMKTPGIIGIQAVAEDDSTYDFYAAPASGRGLLQQNTGISPTLLQLLDIPGFPGDDSGKAVMRIAAEGLRSGWTGAAIYRSDDGGASYNNFSTVTLPAVIGSATSVLANGPSTVFDQANSVNITLIGEGALQSATQLAILNGANAALLGSEIIQFTTATLTGPGQYTLSGLLRGRLGTEWAIGSHAAGEAFALLDSRITKQTVPNNVIGLGRSYKPVSFGDVLSSTAAQDFTYTGIALKPYSPVQISGMRDGSNNLNINWIRRTRLGGEWQDGTDVPLNETVEAYEIDIMHGGDAVRTITGLSSPAADYTAAQQVTDFGSVQSSVAVNIYQISNIVGRGYPGGATL